MKFTGTVQNGRGEGSKIGFPTANIALPKDSNLSGSYAAQVRIAGEGDQTYIAAAYADVERGLLESHLVDFSGDMYSKQITVEVFEKVRDAEVFQSIEALQAAIASDVAKVRNYFHH